MMVISICLVLAAAALPFGGCAKPGPTAPAEPIKIGLMTALTGSFSSFGIQLKLGTQTAFDEVGWQVANRPIQLIIEDDQANPDVAVQKVRKLVESDRVHILTGVCHGGVALAIRDYVVDQKIPFVFSMAAVRDLTKAKASEYIFRTSWTDTQSEVPLMPYAYEKLGIRTIVAVSTDYVTGREKVAGIKAAFEKVGGKVLEEVYTPFGTTDFSPYLTKIKGMKGIDAAWVFEPGSAGIQFVRQWGEYGLGKEMKLIGSTASFGQSFLEQEGDVALGAVISDTYTHTIDSSENRKFVEAYEKISGGAVPESPSEAAYDAGKLIIEAIKACKGNVEDVPKLLEALKTAKIKAPRGPFRLDEYQNVVCDMLILKVERVQGELVRNVIARIPDVGQDWMP
jgi:branched-chain amino acid transport system substrate-binding protein